MTGQRDCTSGWEIVRGNGDHPTVDGCSMINHVREGLYKKESYRKSLQLQKVKMHMSCNVVYVYNWVGVLVNDSFKHSLVHGPQEVDKTKCDE